MKSFFKPLALVLGLGLLGIAASEQAGALDGKTYTVKIEAKPTSGTSTFLKDEIVFSGGLLSATFATSENFQPARYLTTTGGSTRGTINFTGTSVGPLCNLDWVGSVTGTKITGTAKRLDNQTQYIFSGAEK